MLRMMALLLVGTILTACHREEKQFSIQTVENGSLLRSHGDAIGTFVSSGNSPLATEDQITEISSGVFEWKRTWQLPDGAKEQEVRLEMDFQTAFKQTFTMIPGVSYNGNQWTGGAEPKGYEHEGTPWSFAYHRTTIPGATYSEGSQWAVALFGKEEHLETGFACSLIPEETRTTHRLIWPEEENPIVFIGRKGNEWRNKPGYHKTLVLSSGEHYTTTAYVAVRQKEENRLNYTGLLDVAWTLNHRETQPWYPAQKVKSLGIDFLMNGAWNDEEARFKTVLHYIKETDTFTPISESMVGWAGANGSISVSLLEEALRTNNETLKIAALRCLDSWAEQQLANGLIDVAQYVSWFHSQDMSNQAQGAEAFFEAYLLLKKHGIEKSEYRQVALNICDFMLSRQLDSGKFGKAWNNEGVCMETEGTIGSFMVRPMVMAYGITGDSAYLESAIGGFNYYYDSLIKDGFATAGAIDIYTIDKEGAVGLLEGAIKLLGTTNDPAYIHKAEQVAYYLSTWQYHHDVWFEPQTPLARDGYKTFGGTSVATIHQCLDCYGVKYINELVKLSDLTGNEAWKQRAKAIWDHATQGISDGSLQYPGMPPYPRGAQSETSFQTNWGIFLDIYFGPELAQYDNPQGYISNWLVIWPIAYRLDVLRKSDNLAMFE